MPTFFERFSALCKESSETPNSLGKKLGISSGSITAWKNGTIPRMKTLDMLASHFRVSVDYLIGNVNNPLFYLDNERIKREINSYGDEYEKTPTTEGARGVAKTEDEEDMLLLARHMEPIPEEDRRQLKEQFKKSIELYLKARGLSGTEDK